MFLPRLLWVTTIIETSLQNYIGCWSQDANRMEFGSCYEHITILWHCNIWILQVEGYHLRHHRIVLKKTTTTRSSHKRIGASTYWRVYQTSQRFMSEYSSMYSGVWLCQACVCFGTSSCTRVSPLLLHVEFGGKWTCDLMLKRFHSEYL